MAEAWTPLGGRCARIGQGGGGRAEALRPARRSGRRPRAAFPGGYFPAFPGALPRAWSPHSPHCSEHAQVRGALPGTWTSPDRLREAPRKFKAVAAPPPHPLPIRRRRSQSEPQHLPLSPHTPPNSSSLECCLLPVPLQGRYSHSLCPFFSRAHYHRRLGFASIYSAPIRSCILGPCRTSLNVTASEGQVTGSQPWLHDKCTSPKGGLKPDA